MASDRISPSKESIFKHTAQHTYSADSTLSISRSCSLFPSRIFSIAFLFIYMKGKTSAARDPANYVCTYIMSNTNDKSGDRIGRCRCRCSALWHTPGSTFDGINRAEFRNAQSSCQYNVQRQCIARHHASLFFSANEYRLFFLHTCE